MPSFVFNTSNGLPLIMKATGVSPGGQVFVPGRNDVVFSLSGDYSMDVTEQQIATINLYNMRGRIFDNKANYSGNFFFDTVWARQHNNCIGISLDVGLVQNPHGAWSEGNSGWRQDLTSWKGGDGKYGYDRWVKYAYDNISGKCEGQPGSGIIYGSAKTLPNQSFNVGKIDSSMTGFWIGASLNSYSIGWTQWQFLPFPIIYFAAPTISVGDQDLDICLGTVLTDITVTSNDERGALGGTWELQIYTNSDMSNQVVNRIQSNSSNSIVFEDIELIPNMIYFVRAQLRVSSTVLSNWATTQITTASLPRADAIVPSIDASECYNLQHGIFVEPVLTGGKS